MCMRRWASIVAFAVAIGFGAPALAASTTVVLKCIDGANALQIVGKSPLGPSEIVCDVPATLDGTCTFAAICPPCRYATPPCRVPCVRQPRYLWTNVPVGGSQKLLLGSQLFVFRCASNQ